MFTTAEIFSYFGNVIPLDISAPYENLNMDLIQEKKYENKVGNKLVLFYKNQPNSWNIPLDIKTNKPARIELNRGSFFLPHRDLVNENHQRKFIRLNCHPNFTHPEDCTYVINGQIQHWRQGQWMAINPSVCHYSFCYTDNTVHYVIDLDISDKVTHDWFLSHIQYYNRDAGPGNK